MAKDGGGRERLLHESEANLARRVEYERRRRGWSQERLAAQMARAGVPVHQSAISKIERTTDRRAITVDEALAFARVFEIPFDQMLKPVDAAMNEEVDRLWSMYGRALEAAGDAREAAERLRFELGQLIDQNPGADEALKAVLRERNPESHWVDDVPEWLIEQYRKNQGEK